MDSLTHIASGALIGELMMGKRIGRKAMVIGALAQSLPDIDIVASFWLSPTDDLLVHRGITHSLIFMVVTSSALGWVCHRLIRSSPSIPPLPWILFIAVEMTTHLFLDAFNNYGTGWFEPFSSARVTFNTLFVADPLYSLSLFVCFVLIVFYHRTPHRRKKIASVGLVISSLYLCYALVHKFEIDSAVKKELERRHISQRSYFTTPTAFNNFLWYVVVHDTSGFHVGYRSVFDQADSISFQYFRQTPVREVSVKDSTASKIEYDAELQREDMIKLVQFSKGFYTIENQHDTLVFNDLRFGQVAGWTNPRAPFVFHYYINHPEANLLVIQRGRVQGWNRRSIGELVERISGDQH